MVFIGYLLVGKFAPWVPERRLNGFYLAGGQFQALGSFVLNFFIGDLFGTFLLMGIYLILCSPFQIFRMIVCFFMVYVDHIFVSGGRF
jgi:hypothetical protein